MNAVTLARNAMNTRFELVLQGDNPATLQAAGEAALAEVERVEELLSLFRSTSEIAHLNARAAREPVRVSPEIFTLLTHARQLHWETGGAFDITLAPLLRCWGLLGANNGAIPTAEELDAARACTGMALIELDASNFTVRFTRPGVMLDLGAIGKGYAVEQAAEILREAGVTAALIHGGTSTAHALGTPPGAEGWRIAIQNPLAPPATSAESTPPQPVATVLLRDESLSVSAVSGKCFIANGRTLGHIIDPRTGEPASRALLSAVVLPSGTDTDALSTALLVVGPEGHDRIATLRPNSRTLVAGDDGQGRLHCAWKNIEPMGPGAVR